MAKSNARRIGVWGASGSGKTSLVIQKLKGVKRVVVFDPLDDQDYNAAGFTSVHSVKDVQMAMRNNWSSFRLKLVTPGVNEPRYLNQLSALLFRAQVNFKSGKDKRILTLVVDEMSLCFGVRNGEAKAPNFSKVCSQGRHHGIETYGMSQRVAEVSTRFRGNTDENYVLRQQGVPDVDAASLLIGAAKDRVRAIKNLEWMHGKNGEVTSGKITFRK